MENQGLKLTLPTDFEILEFMSDGKRHEGGEIGSALDRKDQYVRNRLVDLRGNGLVRKVPNSRMYVLTDKGRVVLELQDQYSHDRTQEFADEVEAALEEREE